MGRKESNQTKKWFSAILFSDMALPPSIATDAVLVKSENMPEGSETVRGYDFNNGVDYHKLLKSYTRSGFQAMNFGNAVTEINKMVNLFFILILNS